MGLLDVADLFSSLHFTSAFNMCHCCPIHNIHPAEVTLIFMNPFKSPCSSSLINLTRLQCVTYPFILHESLQVTKLLIPWPWWYCLHLHQSLMCGFVHDEGIVLFTSHSKLQCGLIPHPWQCPPISPSYGYPS
jgi:hypothetical protein